MATVRAAEASPSPKFCVPPETDCVWPSTLRLKRPPSAFGSRSLTTLIVPVLRALVIVQRIALRAGTVTLPERLRVNVELTGVSSPVPAVPFVSTHAALEL